MILTLSDAQRKAVFHRHGPLLVLAGPGSGKTRILTEHARYLMQGLHVPAQRILAVTFSRRAAGEMKSRLADTGIEPSTFHGFFYRILRKDPAYVRYRAADTGVCESIFAGVLKDLQPLFPQDHESVSRYLSEIRREPERSREETELLQEYRRRMQSAGLMDFDEMAEYLMRMLTEHPEMIGRIRRRYTHLLIDEFQDISPEQYQIVRMIFLPDAHVFAVGDDDQAIYAFRGAAPAIMRRFVNDYAPCSVLSMTGNYRSAAQIVRASSRLIAHNHGRWKKRLYAANELNGAVRLLRFSDERAEAEQIARLCGEYCRRHVDHCEMAVLARTHDELSICRSALSAAGIPFTEGAQERALTDHPYVRDLLAYFDLAAGSRRRSDLLRVLNKPQRWIPREALDQRTFSFEELIQRNAKKPETVDSVRRLQQDVRMLSGLEPSAALTYIRRVIGFKPETQEEELLEARLRRLAETCPDTGSFLAAAAGERIAADRGDGVSLMTLHAAKGLEFRVVFLLHLNEGLLPLRQIGEAENIEEERRLTYVGMTRAKQLLLLTSLDSYRQKRRDPSRFLRETGLTREETER